MTKTPKPKTIEFKNTDKTSSGSEFGTEERLMNLEKNQNEMLKLKNELDAAPTFVPKTANEQIQFYDGKIYAYIDNTWVAFT